MNLKELKNLIELSKNYSLEIPGDTMDYIYKIYLPVSEAIAKNNKTVIGYLINCEAGDRFKILNAIEDGAERLNPLKAHKLLGIIRKDKKQLALAHG